MIDLQNEKMVLALWFSTGRKPNGITETMFKERKHSALATIFDKGYHTPTNSQLEAHGLNMGEYLDAIESYAGADDNGSIVRSFKKNYLRREKIREKQEELARLVNPTDPVEDLITVDDTSDIYSGGTLVRAYEKDIPLHTENIDFGLMKSQLRATMGGDVVTIAGRSGTGKTALVLQMMENAYKKSGMRSLFFSVEMSLGAICQRMHGIDFYRHNDNPIDLDHLRDECWNDWNKACQTRSFQKYAPDWLIACDKGFHIDSLEARINGARNKFGKIEIVAVDYMQLLEGEGRDRRNEVSYIARKLKQIAKRCNVIILSLSQTSRANEDGTSPVKLHHLKESGDIEEASDLIIGLWKGAEDDHIFVQDIKNRKSGVHPIQPVHKCGLYLREFMNGEPTPSYTEKKQTRFG